RLNVIEVRVPPLRDRLEGITRLGRAVLSCSSWAHGVPSPELSAAADKALLAYGWPGNVPELRNAMERAVILWPARVLTPDALPHTIASAAARLPRVGGGSHL